MRTGLDQPMDRPGPFVGPFPSGDTGIYIDQVARLGHSARWQPYLLGHEPSLADFQLFYVLELSKTFADLFGQPTMNLLDGDERLQRFYGAMSARPATSDILAAKAQELPISRRELFEEFGLAYDKMLKPGRKMLSAVFGHEV